MPVNRFFNQTTYVPEQTLLDDLIIEAIQIHGHSAYYIPREDANLDHLFGEDPLAYYADAREIEVYLTDTSFKEGQSEFITKFGLTIEDRATFLVAQTRFSQEFGDRLTRPREGDILYIQMTPTNRYLFDVKFVEDKEKIFQLGKLYTYELRCELMVYSHERVQTSLPAINEVAEREAYTQELVLETGSGTYLVGEEIYQGDSFITAHGSGTVATWNVSTTTLGVQNIVGSFTANGTITGVTSGAAYSLPATPDTVPIDPASDNSDIIADLPGVIVNRGDNPRFS